jgi:sporulation protein YlmC with PRC-barrel domain
LHGHAAADATVADHLQSAKEQNMTSDQILTSLRLSASVAALALTLGAAPALAQQGATGSGTDSQQSMSGAAQRADPGASTKQSGDIKSGDMTTGRNNAGATGMSTTGDRSAQATMPSDTGKQATNTAGKPDSVRMVRASTFLGRQFNDQAGEQFGDIEYLLIEPVSGKVVFALVGSGGWLNANQDLLAVPFDAIELTNSGDGQDMQLTLANDREAIENAPRINSATLNEITQPIVQTRVIRYWDEANPNKKQGQSQDQGQGQDQSRNQPQQSGAQQSGEMIDPSDTPPDRQASASTGQTGDQSGTQQAGQQTANAAQSVEQPGQQNSQQKAPAGGKTYTLVGKSYITTLGPPLVQTQQQLAGATVMDNQGENIGEIADLVMDADRGVVALALVEHGGFLGIGGQYTALPYQAMTLVDQARFRIDKDKRQLNEAGQKASFQSTDQLDGDKVQQIYQAYDADPYWNRDWSREYGQGSDAGTEGGQSTGMDKMQSNPSGGVSSSSGSSTQQRNQSAQ